MALKVSFSSAKGGVGKSTCTILAATCLSSPPFDYKVAVIDLDRQKSISNQVENDIEDGKENIFDIHSLTLPEFDNNIKNLNSKYDILFFDSGGKLDNHLPVEFQEITRVLSNVDILLIPFCSGNYNLESTIEYINFVQTFNKTKKNKFSIYGFINKFKSGLNTNTQLAIHTKKIQDVTNIKFMRTRLKQYTLFETVDTTKSLYNENASKIDRLNLTVWVNELHSKILTN